MKKVLKLLIRRFMVINLCIVLAIFAITIACGEIQQIIAWELWEKVTLFVTTILPYPVYIIYTKTKYYQIPQLSSVEGKVLREAIAKDHLESISSTNEVELGYFWIKIARKDFGTQVKYIKLDLLAGICFHSYSPIGRVGATELQFIDVLGKIIVMDECRYIPTEELKEIEKKIMERSNAKKVGLWDVKKFALECKNTSR